MDMLDRLYGHLGEVRHRSEDLEFRLEQHRDRRSWVDGLNIGELADKVLA
jgi:hypothetical protein